MVLRSTVIGVFETRDQAHRAVEELHRAGFDHDHIAVVSHHKEGIEVTDLDAAKAAQVTGETKAEEGAAIGAVTGGVLGGLMALPALLPGVGPVFAFGALATSLFGIAAGAAGGGMVGALVGMDFPEEEARAYEMQLKAGRVLVGVQGGERTEEAAAIMRRQGAIEATAPPHHGASPNPVPPPLPPM